LADFDNVGSEVVICKCCVTVMSNLKNLFKLM